MKKIVLEDIEIDKNHFDYLPVILDDEGTVVILPLLFAIHLDKAGEAIHMVRVEDGTRSITKLESGPISESTATTYINHVYRFLKHLNQASKELTDEEISIHHTYLCTPGVVQDYLNRDLASTLTGSSLANHQAALTAYFNFLALLGLRQPHEIRISRKARKEATNNNQSGAYVNYISTKERFEILKRCLSKRDRLIIRCGFELGLRAMENKGMRLKGNKSNEGLLDLFEQLDSSALQHKEKFTYHLRGGYAKRGRSRFIQISRNLLIALREYYLTERAEVLGKAHLDTSNELFLRADPRGTGLPISKRLASDIFAKYRKELSFLDQNLSYHDLRHTFATELYHSELLDHAGRETRSESAALIVVAESLGHAHDRNRRPPSTTLRYIRLREVMLELEGVKE
ncbi:site-specific integrase [Saccharophagus degradans]|uniref:tyrosine-type recombinase/integrase n=1 Tax=Saccharophagus degradans TaxID=86304 RepID=UPI0024781B9B|nr:site-specific integrase [Saccharophagus degradans]WGO96848.1 site-specific integrase [Saccharophagus degradans]